MSAPEPRPPGLAERLLSACLPASVRDSVLGDLHELHARRVRAGRWGRAGATLWYWMHALRIGAGYASRRVRLGRHQGRPSNGASGARPLTRTGGDGMGGFISDVRYALRGLARAPGYTLVAVVTLGLGIGANTAVFSVVNAVYLRPLDFREPERLVRVGQSALDGSWRMETFAPGTWSDWREAQTSFESFAAYRFWTTTVERNGVPSRVTGVHSLGSIFDVLGVPAMLGRTFTAEEEGPGAERLVVLSHPYWQREFGGEDPIGRSLVLEGVAHEIIGVMPPEFRFPTQSTPFWKTADLTAEELLDRDDQFLNAVARLGPGRTHEQASADLARVHDEVRRAHPTRVGDSTPELVPLSDAVLGDVGGLWITLMGAVAFVLLIACLNLANLQLSRAAVRQGELAVRRALGASRARVGRLVVAESLTLSGIGGLAGLGLAWLFLRGILAWMPGGVPRAEVIGFHPAVLAFTLVVTGMAGLVFGTLPSLQVADDALGARLRRSRRGSTHPLRRGLVVGEVALAVVLVSAAGLTLRGYAAVSDLQPGFDPDDRMVLHVELQGDPGDEARSTFYEELVRRVEATAGVRAAGVTSVFPLAGFTPGSWVAEPGVPMDGGGDHPTVRYVGVSTGFRAAAGIPLLRGRDFTDDEDRAGEPALLLSESAARLLFPGEDALGQSIYLGPDGVVAPVSTVVGIVGDVRQTGMAEPPAPMAYVPRDDIAFWRGFHLVVAGDAAYADLGPRIRSIARDASPEAVVLEPRPAADFVAAATRQQRNVMLLFGLLATVALVLAVVGVFGVVSFLVSRRTREIGIRMAVGADRDDVRGLVLRQSLLPVGVGAVLGTAVALSLSRFMEGVVVGVAPTDALTFTVVPLVLAAIAALGAWLPASRASRVDPVGVLGTD